VGKWAKNPQTRINTGFFVAKSVFKSGQKVGKWPLFSTKNARTIKKLSKNPPNFSQNSKSPLCKN
jgi:hypothetical protein